MDANITDRKERAMSIVDVYGFVYDMNGYLTGRECEAERLFGAEHGPFADSVGAEDIVTDDWAHLAGVVRRIDFPAEPPCLCGGVGYKQHVAACPVVAVPAEARVRALVGGPY